MVITYYLCLMKEVILEVKPLILMKCFKDLLLLEEVIYLKSPIKIENLLVLNNELLIAKVL
jgi:hypothetical protein